VTLAKSNKDTPSAQYAEAVAYCRVIDQTPGFVLPLFMDRQSTNRLLTQRVTHSGRIEGFEPIEAEPIWIKGAAISAETGSEYWAGFEWDTNDYQVAPASALAATLIQRGTIDEVVDRPFLHLELIAFCGLTDRVNNALQLAFRSLQQVSPEWAEYWRDNLVLLPAFRTEVAAALRARYEPSESARGRERLDRLIALIDYIQIEPGGPNSVFIIPLELIEESEGPPGYLDIAQVNVLKLAQALEIEGTGIRRLLAREISATEDLSAEPYKSSSRLIPGHLSGLGEIALGDATLGPSASTKITLYPEQAVELRDSPLLSRNPGVAQPAIHINTVFNDEQLIDRRFWLSKDEDPETLPAMLRRARPPEDTGLDFEHIYDRKPAKGHKERLVACAHCGRRNHYRGYVLRYHDGSRILIGKDCGIKHYGLWFHQKQSTFEAHLARANILQKIRETARSLPMAVSEISDIVDSRWPQKAANLAWEFKNRFPKLLDRLSTADRGWLSVQVQERDYERENRRDAKIDEKIRRRAQAVGMDPDDYFRQNREVLNADESLRKTPIFKTATKDVYRLAGHNYLKVALSDAPETLKNILSSLNEQVRKLADLRTDGIKDSELRTHIQAVRGYVNHVYSILNDLGSANAFFSTENMKELANWAKTIGTNEGSYSFESGTLNLRTAGRNLPLKPEPVALPDLPVLAKLRNELRR